MKKLLLLVVLAAVATCDEEVHKPASTAVEVVSNIYDSCVKYGSFSCVKPKVLKFLSAALKNDVIVLTKDLSIVNKGRFSPEWQNPDPVDPAQEKLTKKEKIRFLMLEKIDNFLNTHELKVKLPKEIVTGEVFPFVPRFLLESVPKELTVPLTETENVAQERGYVKKVIIPFLLGLKVKVTTLIPLAIAIIALKTWKALTLGLLSMVLSAAMVIFKFAKPKVVNYEVYHYPSHHPPSPPIVEHPHMDHHGYGRSSAQDLAYQGQRK